MTIAHSTIKQTSNVIRKARSPFAPFKWRPEQNVLSRYQHCAELNSISAYAME